MNDFDGAVIEYNVNYHYLTSKVYKKGTLDKSKTARVITNKNNLNKNLKTDNQNIQSTNPKLQKATQTLQFDETCTDWYYVTYDSYGNEVSEYYLYTTCDGDDNNELGGNDGSGGGGTPPEPITKDVTLTVTETSYTDDDMEAVYTASTDGSVLIPSAYKPVQYLYPAHILWEETTDQIIYVTMDNVIAYPNNETYLGMNGTNITRVVTPVTTSKNSYISGNSVTLSWGCLVTFRWTYANTGVTNTRGITKDYTATVSVP